MHLQRPLSWENQHTSLLGHLKIDSRQQDSDRWMRDRDNSPQRLAGGGGNNPQQSPVISYYTGSRSEEHNQAVLPSDLAVPATAAQRITQGGAAPQGQHEPSDHQCIHTTPCIHMPLHIHTYTHNPYMHRHNSYIIHLTSIRIHSTHIYIHSTPLYIHATCIRMHMHITPICICITNPRMNAVNPHAYACTSHCVYKTHDTILSNSLKCQNFEMLHASSSM